MAQVEDNNAKPKHSINDFLKKPSLILLGLGFSAGMPNLLAGTSWVMGTWLRDSGATLAIIGLVGLVTLSDALKFLWAPLIDRISFPFLDEKLGRRRSWILITQIISMIFLFLIAFTGSCQDIAIDAYRIEASEDTEQLGVLTTMYQFGNRIAFILAMPMAVRMAFTQPVGGGVTFCKLAKASILPLSCCICNDFLLIIVKLYLD